MISKKGDWHGAEDKSSNALSLGYDSLFGWFTKESRSKTIHCLVRPHLVTVTITVKQWDTDSGDTSTAIQLRLDTIDGADIAHSSEKPETTIPADDLATAKERLGETLQTLLERFGITGRAMPVSEDFARSYRRVVELRQRIERRLPC